MTLTRMLDDDDGRILITAISEALAPMVPPGYECVVVVFAVPTTQGPGELLFTSTVDAATTCLALAQFVTAHTQ